MLFFHLFWLRLTVYQLTKLLPTLNLHHQQQHECVLCFQYKRHFSFLEKERERERQRDREKGKRRPTLIFVHFSSLSFSHFGKQADGRSCCYGKVEILLYGARITYLFFFFILLRRQHESLASKGISLKKLTLQLAPVILLTWFL